MENKVQEKTERKSEDQRGNFRNKKSRIFFFFLRLMSAYNFK